MVLDYIWLHPILDVNHAILDAPIYVIATHQAHQREGPKDHVLQEKTMLVTCVSGPHWDQNWPDEEIRLLGTHGIWMDMMTPYYTPVTPVSKVTASLWRQ